MQGMTALRLAASGASVVNPLSPTVPPRARDPDHDVVALLERGDLLAAVGTLMQRHGSAIHRYCREALKDSTLAEDVQQQVFLEAHRDLTGFSGQASLRTWLFGIARHRVLDAVKRQARRRAWEDADEELGEVCDPGPSPVESLDAKQLRGHLVAILAELPEQTRQVVVLRFHHGFTYEEMAALCGAHPAALHARVARALPLLRAALQERLDGTSRRAPARENAKGRPAMRRPRSISC